MLLQSLKLIVNCRWATGLQQTFSLDHYSRLVFKMKRRNFLQTTATIGALSILPTGIAAASSSKRKPILTVAHITDVHIRGNDNVPDRAKNA